jgi:hypothetical protein
MWSARNNKPVLWPSEERRRLAATKTPHALIAKWRNSADAFKEQGNRYLRQQSIAAAWDCFAQSRTFTSCADELEACLAATQKA